MATERFLWWSTLRMSWPKRLGFEKLQFMFNLPYGFGLVQECVVEETIRKELGSANPLKNTPTVTLGLSSSLHLLKVLYLPRYAALGSRL